MTRQAHNPADDMDPLPFEIPDSPVGIGTEKTTTEQTVARAFCPYCATERRTGLVRFAGHFVWRVHHVKTYGSTTMPCRASGALLCATGQDYERLAEHDGSALVAPSCPCQTPG